MSAFVVMLNGLAAPPARASAISFVFTGGGWGHGVGMSQYGAKGQADAGGKFQQILIHYYQGASVAPAGVPGSIRVGVLWDQTEIRVTSDGAFEFHTAAGGGVVATAAAGEVWRVSPDPSGNFVLTRPDGSVATTQPGGTNALFVDFAAHGTLLRLPQTGFRYKYGVFELNTYSIPAGWRVRGIVAGITMQQYLYGLGEVPSSWPAEALKAQAVAGRTYAAEKIGREGANRPTCNCGVYASTADQAYVGFEKEAASYGGAWRAAVDATAGLAVLYSGALIGAFYSSSSGGHTENNENVWGGSPRPYLRGVPDPWDAVSPYFTWTVTFSVEDLQARLNAAFGDSVGALYDLQTLSPYGVSGRVLRPTSGGGGVRITGSGGAVTVSGDQIRSALGLRSTLFRVVRTGVHPNGTLVKGSGPTVYRIEEERLFPIPSPGALSTWGGPGQVVQVEDASLLLYRGADLGFRDGALIRTDDGTVWLISGARKRGFTSPQVFEGLGYSWSNVVSVSWEEASLHPDGPTITTIGPHPDGTSIKASGPTVWWLQGGQRRPIPSLDIFNTWFRWEEVVPVSDVEAASYPDGPALGFRDGTLFRTPDGTVWIASEDRRRGFTSPQVFQEFGYSSSIVKDVSWGDGLARPEGTPLFSSAEAHPTGTPLRGTPSQRFVMRSGVRRFVMTDRVFNSWRYRDAEVVRVSDARLASYDAGNPVRGYRDGSLISTPDGTVWIVSQGQRRGFTSIDTFAGLGYSWSNVRPVPWGEALLHPEGAIVASAAQHPDGTLLQGSGPTVWWLQGGKKRPIPSVAVFESWFRWSEIVRYDDARIASYPDGLVLGFRDGSLVATPDGTVWLISDGYRRGFVSAAAFIRLGYSWSNIRGVSFDEANLHPEGEPIR